MGKEVRTARDSGRGVNEPALLVAIIGGSILSAGFVLFLVNLISTLGIKNVFSLIIPEKWQKKPVASVPVE